MGKAKQSAKNDMSAMDLNNANAMTDKERENLQMTLSNSHKQMRKSNKKSM